MKISDAIDILHDLALEMGDPPDDACITNPDDDNIEAINLAIRILSALDDGKDTAASIISALHLCYWPGKWQDTCPECPYYHYDDPSRKKCEKRLGHDIEAFLRAAYLQGGDSDDED